MREKLLFILDFYKKKLSEITEKLCASHQPPQKKGKRKEKYIMYLALCKINS